MKIKNLFFLLTGILLVVTACEEPFYPDIKDIEPKYVVEAYVEAGVPGQVSPAYAMLSYSIPIYSDIDRSTIENLSIKDATVEMTTRGKTVKLTELCLSDLPEEVRKEMIKQLEISTFDSIDIDFCTYIDINNDLNVQEGDEVSLRVIVKSDTLTAYTTLPYTVPIDSFNVKIPKSETLAGYRELSGYLSDPADRDNYYRVKISVNGSRYIPGFFSVVDDEFFNGRSFDFPLNNTTQFGEDFDPEVFGLYKLGDSISIQWMSIDKAHYDFWSSLEYARSNQGPFSSYTRVKGNVKGAEGVFGGYSTRYYNIVIPD